jgi:hypothetical protein
VAGSLILICFVMEQLVRWFVASFVGEITVGFMPALQSTF